MSEDQLRVTFDIPGAGPEIDTMVILQQAMSRLLHHPGPHSQQDDEATQRRIAAWFCDRYTPAPPPSSSGTEKECGCQLKPFYHTPTPDCIPPAKASEGRP